MEAIGLAALPVGDLKLAHAVEPDRVGLRVVVPLSLPGGYMITVGLSKFLTTFSKVWMSECKWWPLMGPTYS